MADGNFWSEYEKRLREVQARREAKRRSIHERYLEIMKIEALGKVIDKAIEDSSPLLPAVFRNELNSSKSKPQQKPQTLSENE